MPYSMDSPVLETTLGTQAPSNPPADRDDVGRLHAADSQRMHEASSLKSQPGRISAPQCERSKRARAGAAPTPVPEDKFPSTSALALHRTSQSRSHLERQRTVSASPRQCGRLLFVSQPDAERSEEESHMQHLRADQSRPRRRHSVRGQSGAETALTISTSPPPSTPQERSARLRTRPRLRFQPNKAPSHPLRIPILYAAPRPVRNKHSAGPRIHLRTLRSRVIDSRIRLS